MEQRLFKEALDSLNPEQRRAVDTIEGPVMVIAGPGTGKTQILTLRIANILEKTDTRPENILALTFTEAGSRAMRERLHQYIGSAAHRVNIHTFHEFAGELIRTYPEAYARAVGGRPATDLEKVSLLEHIIESSGLKLLRPHGNPAFYIKPLIDTIAHMKREYITPDTLATIINTQEGNLQSVPRVHEKGAHKGKVRSEYQKLEKEIIKNRELLTVYRLYDAALTEQRLFDFEDMIFETVAALETNEDMLRDLQERFQYILADEHQDVNGSQNRILELLASFHERPNLFVVGDEKQAIFRFQGASLENFLYFEERYTDTATITLTENYRSTQGILDVAHTLITSVETPASALRIPLNAHTKEKGSIETRAYSHEAVEDENIAKAIESLVTKGVPKSEIAVIVRSNREVDAFASLIRSCGISVEASADTDILTHPITRTVEGLIDAVLMPENEAALFHLLHDPYWKISTGDLVKLFRSRSYDRPLIDLIGSETALSELSLKEPERVVRVSAVLSEARSMHASEPPHRILEYLFRESGFLKHLMTYDPYEGIRVVRRLYDEVESLVRTNETATLRDVRSLFKTRIAHNLPLNAPYIHADHDAVKVMTAHKSKGLEFTHVFIPHLTDNRWGSGTRPEYFKIKMTKHLQSDGFDREDDERKLLYVALTRAKRGLNISYASQNADGRVLSPSIFLEELGDEGITSIPTDEESTAFNPIAQLEQGPTPVPIDATYLRATLKERGLSATSLNNYLKSPWNYLYRNVLRIPEIEDERLLFGTALHDVICRSTRYRTMHGSLPNATLIKEYLERELGRLPLSVNEYTRLHERGLEALAVYFTYAEHRLPPATREEVSFEARMQTGLPEFPEVLLTGKLDRLDFDAPLEDGGKLVRVVDYKTGRAKTRGQIEGTTKDSDGGYKRQLTFYALLLSLQADERYRAREGMLSFIEPDEKGNIREESYVIADEEVQSLQTDIINVVKEIANGAFLNAPCDPSSSAYCELVELMRKKMS